MNKQQAAEKEFPLLTRPVSVSSLSIANEGLLRDRKIFIAGWEAHEVQLATDALWFKKAIEQILTEEITYIPQVQGFVIHGAVEKLCNLFNPSGAAPQMGNEITKALRELLDEIPPKPKNSRWWHDGLTNAIDKAEKAIFGITIPAPQAAGPVWVKAIDRLPELPNPLPPDTPDEHPVIFFNLKHSATQVWFPSYGQPAEDHFPLEVDVDRRVYDIGFGRENWVWLDESHRQVFTQEQVEKIRDAAMRRFKAHIPELTFQGWFDEYMNTNYPPSK